MTHKKDDDLSRGVTQAESIPFQSAAAIDAGRPQDRAGQGWQPIETAPKDGTKVFVWDGFDVMVASYFDLEVGGEWVTEAICAEAPTHWMPLPAAPTERG